MAMSKNPPPSAPPARPSRGWRIARGVGLALVVLGIAGVAAARWYLTDARLAGLAADTLNGQFAGAFRVGRVHWRLPLTLVVEDVAIAPAPGADADLTVDRVVARLHVLPLLHRRIDVGPLRISGMGLA